MGRGWRSASRSVAKPAGEEPGDNSRLAGGGCGLPFPPSAGAAQAPKELSHQPDPGGRILPSERRGARLRPERLFSSRRGWGSGIGAHTAADKEAFSAPFCPPPRPPAASRFVPITFSKHICPTRFCHLSYARDLLNQLPRAVTKLSSRVGLAGCLRTPSCTPQAGPRRARGAQRAPAPGGPFRPGSCSGRRSSRAPGALLSSRHQGAPETAGGPAPTQAGGCAVIFNKKKTHR